MVEGVVLRQQFHQQAAVGRAGGGPADRTVACMTDLPQDQVGRGIHYAPVEHELAGLVVLAADVAGVDAQVGVKAVLRRYARLHVGLEALASCLLDRPVRGLREHARMAVEHAADPTAGAKPDNKPGPRPERLKWWIDPKLRAELAITDQQSAAVEQVWQKSAPWLREAREKLTKLEDVLSKLTDGTDEALVIAQSERVETLRAELNKARTLMIYRMNKILTADQRAKVRAMYDHSDPGRRGPSPGKPSSDK